MIWIMRTGAVIWKQNILDADHFKDVTFRTKGRNRDRDER